MKKLSQQVSSYTAVFEPAEEGGYVVSVPALPGCATQGDTFEEAQANIKDALAGYLQVLHESGEEIPTESEGTIISRIPTSLPR